MNRLLPVAAFVLLPLAWSWSNEPGPAPLSPDRPVASLIPARCLVYVEGTGLLPLFEQGLEHPFARALLDGELGRALVTEWPRSPAEALESAEAWLGAPLLPVLADLARNGLALGFDPRSKKAVVVALGRDPESVERGSTQAFDALERQLGLPGAFDRAHDRWSGAEVWKLGEDGCVARREALLVLGNDGELVRDVLEMAADPAGRGLLDRPGFAASHGRRGRDEALWTWLELEELEACADEGYLRLRAAKGVPAVQGVFGERIAALLSARSLAATLALDDGRGLRVRLHAFEAGGAAALAPHARTSEVPVSVASDGDVASALLYRDYSRFLTARTELFPPEVLPAFAEAVTAGALFFGGKDPGEEVLNHLSPWLRLVSREPEFAPGRRPEIALPGLAAVAVLDDELAGEEWISAFQTIVSVANVDGAQQGRPAMRLRLGREGEVDVSSAHFATPAEGDGVDVRFNLEPAVAVVGRHLVLGTHVSLVRSLVRELAGEEPVSATDEVETLELDAGGLRDVVVVNFDALVAQKMLEDGLERAAAERAIGSLRLALAAFEGARVELSEREPGAPELSLELCLARGEPMENGR